MSKIPRAEQEAVILYDVELDEWTLFTDYPKLIRRWRDKLDPITREEFYHDGTEKMIEGVINGSVSIRGKRKLTKEQKEELAERMKVARQAQGSI